MTPERGVFLKATQDFEVSVADTSAALGIAYRLRHQVYCIERGHEPGQGILETDRFDRRASHVLLIQRSTGRVVGTVRVIAPSLDGPGADLPMQLLCCPAVFRALPMGRTGEIGPFAIATDLHDAACAGSMPLRLGLMRGVVQLSAGMGITHWCTVMERALLRPLRANAIHFQPLGPAIEHHGLRQPSWGCIDDVLARLRHERPAVWDYVTEGGSLWQQQADAMAA